MLSGERTDFDFDVPEKSKLEDLEREYTMVSKKVVVMNPTGLHLKPAAIFCKEAMNFKSTVTFTFGNATANAKSVLSVLAACVKSGDEIEIICVGPDEEEALDALVSAVKDGLGEKAVTSDTDAGGNQ